MNGAFYPSGGTRKIVQNIISLLEYYGSKVLVNCGVKEIIIKNNKAIGVIMDNNDKIYAPIIISGTGIRTTYKKLIQKKIPIYETLLKKIKPSIAYFNIFIC